MTGIRLDHAGIDGKCFASHQPRPHAFAHDVFKHAAEQVALAKPPMTVLGECRMVRDRPFKPKPTEPSVGEVEVNLSAQPLLRANAVQIAD
jgi:hypothetical protein